MAKNKNTVWFAVFKSSQNRTSPSFITKSIVSAREEQERLQKANGSLYWVRCGRPKKDGTFEAL